MRRAIFWWRKFVTQSEDQRLCWCDSSMGSRDTSGHRRACYRTQIWSTSGRKKGVLVVPDPRAPHGLRKLRGGSLQHFLSSHAHTIACQAGAYSSARSSAWISRTRSGMSGNSFDPQRVATQYWRGGSDGLGRWVADAMLWRAVRCRVTGFVDTRRCRYGLARGSTWRQGSRSRCCRGASWWTVRGGPGNRRDGERYFGGALPLRACARWGLESALPRAGLSCCHRADEG